MVELTSLECDEVTGGWWAQFIVAVAVYDAVTDFAKGYAEGVEASQK